MRTPRSNIRRAGRRKGRISASCRSRAIEFGTAPTILDCEAWVGVWRETWPRQAEMIPATTPWQTLFDDSAAYERFMGRWSLAAGAVFLDWLAPERGLRWLD